MTSIETQSLRTLIDQAGGTIARCWPLRTFAYRNPLQGLESLPFDDAVRRGEQLFGGRGYLPDEACRALARDGRIGKRAIREALARTGLAGDDAPSIRIGPAAIDPVELLRLHLCHGFTATDDSRLQWWLTEGGALRAYRRDVPAAARTQAASDRLPELWRAIVDALGPAPSDAAPDAATGEPARHPLILETTAVGRSRTMADCLDTLTGDTLTGAINDQMIRWCAAFLDDGMADWPMPERERGFYQAWRGLAGHDPALALLGIADAAGTIGRLPGTPEAAIALCLSRLGLPEERWADYLTLHLAQLPGWAGLIKWRQADRSPAAAGHPPPPIDLTHYLAVRLIYETELVEMRCRARWGIGGTLPELQTLIQRSPDAVPPPADAPHAGTPSVAARDGWRLFHVAQFLGLSANEIRAADPAALRGITALLDQFATERHGPVWLDAMETDYRDRVLETLRAGHTPPPQTPDPSTSPPAQVFFCIDARSERLRRRLEALDRYETFGFAGFFGVPICYQPYDDPEGPDHEQLLCPPLITPKRLVVERPRPDQEEAAGERVRRSGWHRTGLELFHRLKGNNLTAYAVIDLLGALFGLTFLARTLLPALTGRWRRALDRRLHPPVATAPLIDRPGDRSAAAADSDVGRLGFTPGEQATFVENALRVTGLTERFARLVLFCAHGSASENNPYASAYDCGACGGRHGGPNARVLAAMANKTAVRAALQSRGLPIPEATVFMAGEHNTTTDEVVLFDAELIPESHREEATSLAAALNEAGRQAAAERAVTLPGGSRLTTESAARHVARRSADWSEVRPEWGLSGNAAFLIGRRALSRGVDLAGRVFLHSYDARQDPTGERLEAIMTAPLLVVQWIGMEYYFSATDPWRYGSGSKALHNVVGGVGVMLGRHGDLRPGLPLQSVTDGASPYHLPMRTLILIEAPAARVAGIIAEHGVLQRLFDHRWLRLAVLEPADGAWREHRPGGQWTTLPAGAGAEAA